MNADFWAGLATGLALIVAIGSQNAFVLRCGIRREHVLPIVLFCAASDALLIAAGVGGTGTLLRSNALLMDITRYGGALFLASYGLLAARRAFAGEHLHVEAKSSGSLGTALAACFAFTFLNPHVYLDTVVLLGTVAAQRGESGRWVFGVGAMCGSVLWFSALGFGARLLAPWFEKAIAWRILDSLIALVMLTLAWSLLQATQLEIAWGIVAFAGLRLAHLREFVECSVCPMQGQVDGLASQPEKLQTIRSEFEDLALQVTANDGQ